MAPTRGASSPMGQSIGPDCFLGGKPRGWRNTNQHLHWSHANRRYQEDDVGTDFAAIANISLALSLLVALVFGVLQFRAAARDRRERLTMETLREFQSRDFAAKINMIRLSGPPETVDKLSERPADEQIEILQLAQEMESVGLMVEERMIDLDLVEKSLGSFVVDAWKRYAPLMRSGRDKD